MKKRNIIAALFVLVLFSLFVMGCGSKPVSSDKEAAAPEPANIQTPTPTEQETINSSTGSSGITGDEKASSVAGVKGGVLYTMSKPSMANLYLDGKRRGTTSNTLYNLTPGTHNLVLSKSGYENYTGTVEIVAGKTTKLELELKALGA